MVIVPVLDVVNGFAVALMRKEPLPVRFAGAILSIVSQPALLVGAFHVVLDVTVIVLLLTEADGFHAFAGNISVGACCVTRMG